MNKGKPSSPRGLPPIDWITLGKQGLEMDMDGDNCSSKDGMDDSKSDCNRRESFGNLFVAQQSGSRSSSAISHPRTPKGYNDFVNSSSIQTSTIRKILCTIISYLPLTTQERLNNSPKNSKLISNDNNNLSNLSGMISSKLNARPLLSVNSSAVSTFGSLSTQSSPNSRQSSPRKNSSVTSYIQKNKKQISQRGFDRGVGAGLGGGGAPEMIAIHAIDTADKNTTTSDFEEYLKLNSPTMPHGTEHASASRSTVGQRAGQRTSGNRTSGRLQHRVGGGIGIGHVNSRSLDSFADIGELVFDEDPPNDVIPSRAGIPLAPCPYPVPIVYERKQKLLYSNSTPLDPIAVSHSLPKASTASRPSTVRLNLR